MVASTPAFKRIMLSGSSDVLMKKQFLDILKLPNFRKEMVELLTLYLNKKANLPNFIVVMGTDF